MSVSHLVYPIFRGVILRRSEAEPKRSRSGAEAEPKRSRRICFLAQEQKQILRSSTPATAKAAVAGDPGFAQDDTSQSSPDTLTLKPL